jgi:60 kDa SS-A/Ro ribonucleoprotein
MRLNVFARDAARTHEGAPAVPRLPSEKRLQRSVLSCLLWEDEFYEDGQSIAARIVGAAEQVAPTVLAGIAIEAREVFNLRHVPLLLLEVLSRTGQGDKLVADTVARVVQRADELAELVALHHKLGAKKMIPAQMRKGLARALAKFDAYALAKYDRDSAVKLRDVLRLVRPTPMDAEQSALWKGVKERTLQAPDTWEVALSSVADKKQTFERLLRDGKLGYLALCATCATWRTPASMSRWCGGRSWPARARIACCRSATWRRPAPRRSSRRRSTRRCRRRSPTCGRCRARPSC